MASYRDQTNMKNERKITTKAQAHQRTTEGGHAEKGEAREWRTGSLETSSSMPDRVSSKFYFFRQFEVRQTLIRGFASTSISALAQRKTFAPLCARRQFHSCPFGSFHGDARPNASINLDPSSVGITRQDNHSGRGSGP